MGPATTRSREFIRQAALASFSRLLRGVSVARGPPACPSSQPGRCVICCPRLLGGVSLWPEASPSIWCLCEAVTGLEGRSLFTRLHSPACVKPPVWRGM